MSTSGGYRIDPGTIRSEIDAPRANVAFEAKLGILPDESAEAIIQGGDEPPLNTVHIGERAAIGPHVSIVAGSSVGRDSEIWPGTFVGHNIMIGERTRIVRTRMYGHIAVGDDCVIAGADIATNVTIGSGSRVDGKLRSDVALGRGARIGPGVVIDMVDIPDEIYVAAGATVTEQVPRGFQGVIYGRDRYMSFDEWQEFQAAEGADDRVQDDALFAGLLDSMLPCQPLGENIVSPYAYAHEDARFRPVGSQFQARAKLYGLELPNDPVQAGGGTICMEEVEIGAATILGEKCYASSGVSIGFGCNVEDGCRFEYRANVGNFVNVGAESVVNGSVSSFTTIGRKCQVILAGLFSSESGKHTVLEDYVFVGHGCVVVGARIGRGSYLAASAVVTKDVPPYHVVRGVNEMIPLAEWHGVGLRRTIQ